MKFKLIALSLCMIASANVVKGQTGMETFSLTGTSGNIRLLQNPEKCCRPAA